MAISDPIADMLTRVRNAVKAKMNSVDVPASKLKTELARVMKDEGYIKNYKFIQDGKQGILRVYLKYGPGQQATIYGLERVSKPSRRIYVKSREIDPVNVGFSVGNAPGAFKFDTSKPGNRNTGHEFGTSFRDSERWDLIEYLKTL